MLLAVFAVAVQSVMREQFAVVAGEAAGMGLQRFARDVVERHAADSRMQSAEIFFQHLAADAHRFENLRPAVAAQGGNPHLGKDFQQPLVHRLNIIFLGGMVVELQFVPFHQVV